MRSTQPRWVTDPTMKPTLVPPRHSSTPTCTRATGCCAPADIGAPSKVAAKAAIASERRMKEKLRNPNEGAVMRAEHVKPPLAFLCHNRFHRTKEKRPACA